MKQGTISILIGCHSIMHSFQVVRAWRYLYGRRPRLWELVCIFLHDIGHWGLDYLDSVVEKDEHWRLGARLACRLFGVKGFRLIAGHSGRSTFPISMLYKADKYSWYIAPNWWLLLNYVTEPKLAMGYSRREALVRFKSQVRDSIESGRFRPTHAMYLDRCKEVSDVSQT